MSDSQRIRACSDELALQRKRIVELNERKSTMIAVLAHDIKGPLTSIIGFAELLEEGFVEGDGAADAARTIRSNAERLAKLANDISALSRIESGDLELAEDRLDLCDVALAVVAAHVSHHPVALTSCGRAIVLGDRERLAEALDHIVGNAVKYSPADEPVEVSISVEDGHATITVRDRGLGIPPDDHPRVFEPFARGSNVRRAKIPGTGIGLFVAREAIERHGGTIEFSSTAGEGSTFIAILPTVDASAALLPKRVTIISADRDLRRFFAAELRARAYRVQQISALDGPSQLESVRAGDTVLLDAGVAEVKTVRSYLVPRSVRILRIGVGDDTNQEHSLPSPLLLSELLAALDADGQ